MLATIRQQTHSEPVIFAVSDADAITQRFSWLESYDIKKGEFSSQSLQPSDDITTLVYSERLTANTQLDKNVAADVTRLLFSLKTSIAHQVPPAHSIDAIELEQAAK